MPLLISTSVSLPVPAWASSGYENARWTIKPTINTTIRTEPITTARATRNDRFDIRAPTLPLLLLPLLQVEPRLEDQRGRLLIDHALAFRSRHIGIDEDPLRLGCRETLVLLVK